MTHLWLMLGNVAAASDYAHTWSKSLLTPSGELDQVNDLPDLMQHGIYGSDSRDMWSEIPLLTVVRLKLAQGKLDGLGALLEDVCGDVETRGWTNILVEALILKALVLYAEGKLAHALKTLGNVLAMTEKEGYVRVFVDEGLPMYQLLQRAASRDMALGYVSKLLSAFNMPDSGNPDQSGRSKTKGHIPLQRTRGPAHMTEPLTSREIEVLRLIAAGASNQAIADKLFISFATVKNHIHNTYAKLDVGKRTQAIIRAQELGLLKAKPRKV